MNNLSAILIESFLTFTPLVIALQLLASID